MQSALKYTLPARQSMLCTKHCIQKERQSKSRRKKLVTYSVEPLAFFTPLCNGHLPPTRVASPPSQQCCEAQIASRFSVQLHYSFPIPVQEPLWSIGHAQMQNLQTKTTGTARATSPNGKLLLTCENAPVKGSPLTSMQWAIGRVQLHREGADSFLQFVIQSLSIPFNVTRLQSYHNVGTIPCKKKCVCKSILKQTVVTKRGPSLERFSQLNAPMKVCPHRSHEN